MKKIQLYILCVFVVFIAGCSAKSGTFVSQSHFTYPNSNVIPLGHVKADETFFSMIIYPSFDKEEMLALFNKALAQKVGADLLINYTVDTKITLIPIPILYPAFLTVTFDGTAASMEIGKQDLH